MKYLAIFLACLAGIPSLRAAEPEKVELFQKGEKYGYRIPSVVVTKKGTVLAFAERRVGLHDHAQNDLVVRRSTDHGRTFGEEIFVHEDGANVLVNPCAVVLDSGRVLIMYQWFKEGRHARAGGHMKLLDTGYEGDTVSRTLVVHSDDDGLTWSKPRDVTRGTKRPTVVSTATGPGNGIIVRNGPHKGRIIMPTNEGWFVGKGRNFNVYACFSDDGGETWSMGANAPVGDAGMGNECQVVELTDGRLMLNSRGYTGERRKVAVSNDGGATWSKLVADDALVEPRCQGTILRYTGSDGKSRLLFANPDSPRSKGRHNGTVRISYDEGKTWPVGRVIEPGYYSYSSLVQLADGNIGLLYEAEKCHVMRFARIPLAWLEAK